MDDFSSQGAPSRQPDNSEFNVLPCFMPDQPCVDKIVEWINNTKQSIMVQAYKLSSRKIADALINAKNWYPRRAIK